MGLSKPDKRIYFLAYCNLQKRGNDKMDLSQAREILLSNTKAQFNDYTLLKADELISTMPSEHLSSLALNLSLDSYKKCKSGFYGLNELAFYIKETLLEIAKSQAKNAKIQGFRESHLQEQQLLEIFFYKKLTENMPLWFKEL